MLRKLAHFLDFLLFPLAAVIFTVTDPQAWQPQWIAIGLAGIVAFTYIEYWVHRVVLHRLLWHGKHERHHRHPEEYTVFPFWALPLGFGIFYSITSRLTGSNALFVGAVLGYLWFITWHHVMHHVDLTRWPRFVQRYAAWHMRHHDGAPFNYGITHPLWDILHGTSR